MSVSTLLRPCLLVLLKCHLLLPILVQEAVFCASVIQAGMLVWIFGRAYSTSNSGMLHICHANIPADRP